MSNKLSQKFAELNKAMMEYTKAPAKVKPIQPWKYQGVELVLDEKRTGRFYKVIVGMGYHVGDIQIIK